MPTRLRIALLILLLVPAFAGAQVQPDEYASRRQALAAQIGRGAVVAFGTPEPRVDYLAFVQGSRFYYLTGYREPSSILVTIANQGRAASMLFVHPRDPATEVWSGRRFGPEGAEEATGIPARPLDQFETVLDSLARGGVPLSLVSDAANADGDNPDLTRIRTLLGDGAPTIADAGEAVDRLRGTKSPAELELIRKAVAMTVGAQREAMRAIEPGMNEFEVQALIEYTFRRNGADRPGFATIVGSGPNSTTLHYNANDRFMQEGELVVMDIGASYRGYTADVTRTVPVNGTFSPEQRRIYEIVRAAQAAAERAATLGSDAVILTQAAAQVLALGLTRLGLIQAPDATYDCPARGEISQCLQLQLFYMHGLGHGIGLDVHDPEQFYHTRRIEAGSAFTIEPGLYVRANVLETLPETPRNREIASALRDAVARYANIGVRIEDDYIATAQGVEWISRAPRELSEVEEAMRAPYTGPAPRDPGIIDWYRATEPRPALPAPPPNR
ncbi:MAG: aminopeptidase P N-terminal domain-containing protein [Gemmatimonadaceae bacterium]